MAQRLAQATHNRLVVGSNPTGPTFDSSFKVRKSFQKSRKAYSMSDFLGLQSFTPDLYYFSYERELRRAEREARLKRNALLFDKIALCNSESLVDTKNNSYRFLWEKEAEWASTLIWLIEQQVIFPHEIQFRPEAFSSSLTELATYTLGLLKWQIGANQRQTWGILQEIQERSKREERILALLERDSENHPDDGNIKLEIEKHNQEWMKYVQSIQGLLANESEQVNIADSYVLRMFARQMELLDKETVIPILPISNYLTDVPIATKSEVIEIVIRNLPLPSATTPWEAIIDYRNDNDTRKSLRALRHWINKISSKNVPANEIEEELETLISEFDSYMKLHKLKADTDVLQTFVKAPLTIIENLLKLTPSNIVDPLFAFRKRQLSLMEAEINAPGKEIAYILRTNETFSESN
jgi:hypothetical protein